VGYTKPETKAKWRNANRDAVNARQRELYAANREHRLLLQKGYNEKNALAIQARQRAAYAANPEKYKARSMLARHGLTLVEYETLLAEQGGRCATCPAESPGGRSRLFHVDHDHSCCGPLKSCARCRRGLLCSRCNVGIGMFRDDPVSLMGAARYLEQAANRFLLKGGDDE
jgi:hypothetical protein